MKRRMRIMITIGMRLTMTMMVFTQGSCVSFNTVEQALDSLKLHETDVKVRCSVI